MEECTACGATSHVAGSHRLCRDCDVFNVESRHSNGTGGTVREHLSYAEALAVSAELTEANKTWLPGTRYVPVRLP